MMRRFVIFLVLPLVVGCASSAPKIGATGDPITDLSNPDLSTSARLRAADAAWREAVTGTTDREETRSTFKAIAASQSPPELRIALIEKLLDDPDAQGLADTRRMIRVRLIPRDHSLSMLTYLSEVSIERGWTDMIPSLVQSWSRPDENIPDAKRPERRAIQALDPNRSPERAVFEVFLNPPREDTTPEAADYLQNRMRTAAWGLLSRIDRTGRMRGQILAMGEELETAPESRPMLQNLRKAFEDFGVVPVTAEELRWLGSLREGSANQAWWEEAAGAVSRLEPEQRAGLQMCHVEAVRWAAANRPAWLGASRDHHISELAARLRTRRTVQRSRGADESIGAVPERLSRWEDQLRWGDVISILVIDEVLKSPLIRAELFRQADMDREDTTTEYGGIINLREEAFEAVLYPPRPAQRYSDTSFIASSDMIRDSDRSLVHYHFHVRNLGSSGYAGPSWQDIEYAARHGRNCMVFTAVRSDVLDADFYCPAGFVIDLGTFERPTAVSADK